MDIICLFCFLRKKKQTKKKQKTNYPLFFHGCSDALNVYMQIFFALLLHKIVIGFSLGVRLVQSTLSSTTALLCSIIFAAQIIIGGFGGIAILDFVSRGSPLIAGTVSFITQVILRYIYSCKCSK